jgi:hypothetical protein
MSRRWLRKGILIRSLDREQSVADDRQAAQEHGRHGDEGIQKAGHGDGDGNDVVEAREDKVQADFSVHPGCEREEIENLGQISTHEGDAARFLAKMVVFLCGLIRPTRATKPSRRKIG